MGEKEQLFLTRTFQLVKIEEMSEREIQPQNTTAIAAAGKLHRWVLKLAGESFRRNNIFT